MAPPVHGGPPAPPRARRFKKRWLVVPGALVGTGLAALAVFGLWIGTGGGSRWVANRLEGLVEAQTYGGDLRIESLDLGLFETRASGITLADAAGQRLLAVERLDLTLDPLTLLTGAVHLPSATVTGLVVDVRQDADGSVDWARLFVPGTGTEPFSMPVDVRVDALAVERLDVRFRTPTSTPFELHEGHVWGRLVAHATTVDLSELDAGAELLAPGPIGLGIWGGVQWDSRKGVWVRDLQLDVGSSTIVATGLAGTHVDLAVSAERLEGADLGTLLGHPLAGGWAGTMTAKGSAEDFALAAGVRSLGEDGSMLALAGRGDASGERVRWSAKADLDRFHVEVLEPALGRPVVLDGLVSADGSGATVAGVVMEGTWRGTGLDLYGQAVDVLDAHFRMRDGRLELLPSLVEGVLGTMSVAGTFEPSGGALDLAIDSDLDPRRLAVLGSPGLDGTGRLSARLRRPAGASTVEITGTARYAPFRYGPDVRVDVLTAPFAATVTGGVVSGTVDLTGRGVSAYGASADGVSARALSFQREADGQILVSGSANTPGLRYADRFGTTTADTSFSFWKDAAHRTVEATTAIGPHQLLSLPGTGGSIRTSMSDDQVRAEVVFGDGVRRSLVTTARYDLSTARLVLDDLAWAPTPRTTWVADAPVTMTVVDGGMADGHVVLSSALGRVRVDGDVALSDPLEAGVRLEGFELDHLTELFPDRFDLGGRLELAVDLRGTAEAPVVDGTVALERLFVAENVRWLDVSGPFRWADGRVVPSLDVSAAGTPLAHLDASVPLSGGLAAPLLQLDDDARVSLSVVPGPFDRLPLVFPAMADTALPEGRVGLFVDATGPLRDPDVHVAGIAVSGVSGWTEPGRIEFELHRHLSELRFDVDVREGLGLRGIVDGAGATRMAEVFAWLHALGPEVPLTEPATWVSDLDVATALVGVPARSVGVLAGVPVDLGGELVGGFRVTGAVNQPVVDGAVNWLEPAIGGQPFDGAYFALQPAGEGYTVDVAATFPEGGGVEVHGAVPVRVDLDAERAAWSRGPLALVVSGPGVPVSLLGGVDPDLRGVQGLVQVAGTVGGTFDAPRPEVTLHGEGLGVLYRPYGVTTEAASLDATLTADAVTFDVTVPTLPARKFTTMTLDPALVPRVRTKGTVALADWIPGAVDAKVHLDDGAWLAATDLTKLRMDGDLRLSGTWPALQVRGGLQLVQGLVGFEAAGFAEAAPLDLAPTLSVVRSAAPSRVVRTAEPPLSADFDVDVKLDLARNLQLELSMPFVDQFGGIGAMVTRVDLATRLGGAVAVSSNRGEPELTGELELVEGTVRLMRSTFDLEDGRISFTGGDPYEDAELDVDAVMAVSGGTLQLVITGTPVSPEFALQSEEYPDPTQQMVILLTGTAPDDLTADAGAGAALSLLWTSVLAGTRLGSFSIEPSGAVRLGFPVSQKLYTSTTWLLSTDPTVNSLTFEADWSLLPHLVANGAVGDRNSWGDLYWEIRF